MNHSIRTLILSASILLTGISAHAEQRWCAVTESALIVLDDIDCLVGTDDSIYFSILFKNGTIIYNVTSMAFELREMSGNASINGVPSDQEAVVVNNVIHISHASYDDTARIVGLDGSELISAKIVNGGCDIDISHFNAGVYVLNFGGESFKFLKK